MAGFLRQLNVGREISCLLCEQKFPERRLLQHICEVHFPIYRPYKCFECDFRAGVIEILHQHASRHGHVSGYGKPLQAGVTNQEEELIINMVFRQSLMAHNKDDNFKNSIIQHMLSWEHMPGESSRNSEMTNDETTDSDSSPVLRAKRSWAGEPRRLKRMKFADKSFYLPAGSSEDEYSSEFE